MIRYVPTTTPVLLDAPGHGWRTAAATSLRAAGRLLDGLAARLTPPAPERGMPAPVIEFHAEAGAPEGALYVDGRLVGTLEGVRRL